MDSMQAYLRAKAAEGSPQRVFDWNKAAEIIRNQQARHAGAGLSGDWGLTGGDIFRDGKPVPKEDTYVYLSSNWATPELEVDGETIDCWVYETDELGWDAHTYWPPSALAILEGRSPAQGDAKGDRQP